MNDVIDSTTPVRLRAILKGLSERTSDNWAHIHSELMVPPGTLKRTWLEKEDESGDSSLDESEYSDEQSNATASIQRYEVCEQCKEEYNTSLNGKKDCMWHPGKPRNHRTLTTDYPLTTLR